MKTSAFVQSFSFTLKHFQVLIQNFSYFDFFVPNFLTL